MVDVESCKIRWRHGGRHAVARLPRYGVVECAGAGHFSRDVNNILASGWNAVVVSHLVAGMGTLETCKRMAARPMEASLRRETVGDESRRAGEIQGGMAPPV